MIRYLTLEEVLELHRLVLAQSGGLAGAQDLGRVKIGEIGVGYPTPISPHVCRIRLVQLIPSPVIYKNEHLGRAGGAEGMGCPYCGDPDEALPTTE
jgi:hypothetical protein